MPIYYCKSCTPKMVASSQVLKIYFTVFAILQFFTPLVQAQMYEAIFPADGHRQYTGLFGLDEDVYRVGYENVIEMTSDNGEHWRILSPTVPHFNIVHVESTKKRALALISPMRWAPEDWEDSTHSSVMMFTSGQAEPTLLRIPWFIPVRGLFRFLQADVTEDAIFISQAWEESIVIRTTDVGATWTVIPTPDSLSMNQYVEFLDKDRGFMIAGIPNSVETGVFSLFVTTDAGSKWERIPEIEFPIPAENEMRTPPLQWLSRDSAVLVDNNNRTLLTTDGGMSWTEQSKNYELPNIVDLHFGIGGTGYFVCTGGVIAKTGDYGRNTVIIRDRLYLDGNQNPVVYVTETDGILYADETGVTAHSTDGGATWTDDTYQLYIAPRRLTAFTMDTVFASVYPTREMYHRDWYIITGGGGGGHGRRL